MLPLSVSGRTHRGGRRQNEDAFGWVRGPNWLAVVLADGMGGEVAGRVAGRMGVGAALARFRSIPTGSLDAHLHVAVGEAHRAVLSAGEENPNLLGMAATMVAAIITSDCAWVSWLGDSRAYLSRGDRVEQLTHDHAERKAEGWVVTRYLGAVDHQPEVTRVCLEPGDRLVLCSDGVWDGLDGRALARIVADGSATDAARRLIRDSLRRGTSNNATAVVVTTAEHRATEPDGWSMRGLLNRIPRVLLR